jgi:hypothetical protein
MYKILLTFLIFGVFQCDKQEVNAEKGMAGEWRYVGTFNHTTDYTCYVCSDFDYEKSLYRLTFNDDKSYTAKINLLIGKGEYITSIEKSENDHISGTFENLNLQILNKPYETEADSKFQSMFMEANNFVLSTNNNGHGYDELILGSNNNEYLLFVRK